MSRINLKNSAVELFCLLKTPCSLLLRGRFHSFANVNHSAYPLGPNPLLI
jgi:hypothetical protein